MDLQLASKVGVVTGASRGIGRAIAAALAAEGMHLALVARSRDQLEELAATLPTPTLVLVADLRDADAPASAVAATVSHFGRLDLLVNNAGATTRGDFLTLPETDWQDGFGLKFFGAMRCCRAAWSHLQATAGAIVNIAGIGGRTGSAEFTIGGAVNAALLNLTKALADRGVGDGVRVNAVNPGTIATDRLRVRIEQFAADKHLDVEQAATEMARAARVGRFGSPGDIAAVVQFLASSQAGYLQGSVIDVDGGQTRTL